MLITNILNWEGYSKLEQTVKENVKAVLSENKQLILVSFVVLIQTLKADPQMVKLIYNTPARNNGEQLKNDDNNIKKYLEFNRDRIWKPFEALTINAINTVADSSSNSILSLPQSSSRFPNLSK